MNPATRGQTIKRARRRHGYSQSVLAGLVGRSESWLSQVERGILTVDSHEVLNRLSLVLRLDLSELTGTESETFTHVIGRTSPGPNVCSPPASADPGSRPR